MKNLEQQFSEDLLITQSSNSVREYSDPIPVDVLIDIFSRVPAKSIGRFRCVSKFWESILGRHDFTELFLTKSVARPRLFFALEVNKELFVFSSPQPQSPDDNSSLVATPYKHFPKNILTGICTNQLCGLVFLQNWGIKRKAPVICNPVTGESITVPKLKGTGFGDSYLGFDPINKQFKVLCMTRSRYGKPNTRRILTLETGKLIWRTIQDPVLPHDSIYHEGLICINGVLYFKDSCEGFNCKKIVCFDIRFEKFSVINIENGMFHGSCNWTLFNCKGKLGAHQYAHWYKKQELVLYVLEDAGKHKWSKSIFILPSIVSNMNMIVGMTGSGEIVFTTYSGNLSNPFYIFFYNIQRKTYARVEIQGFEEFKHHSTYVHTFLDFVEDIKFII